MTLIQVHFCNLNFLAPTIKTQEKVGLQSIWKNKQVLTILLTFCFSWYTVSMSSFAIDLNSPTLSGSFFVNQFLFAVVIMCSKFVCMVTLSLSHLAPLKFCLLERE